MTNRDLVAVVNNIINENGVKKTFIAEKVGVSRQQLDNILKKQSFSIDDANKILNVIGYEIDSVAIKKL